MPTDSTLLNAADAARYLAKRGFDTTGQTLRRWADEKRIRHVRMPSGLVRFRAEDLDGLLTPVEPNEPSAAAS